MGTPGAQPATVDEYIAACPAGVQPVLHQLRAVIREAAPDSVEKISYQMPAFHQNGALVWFAAHQRHIGFYPTAEGIEAFKDELAAYKTSKGAIQLPLDQPMPFDLLARIVKHRVAVNQGKAGARKPPRAKANSA